MIVFDLKCGSGHVFEAWFGSSSAFNEQRDGGLVACPICGDGEVEKAMMAPNIGAKGNQGPGVPPAAMKAAMAALAAAQSKALENSTWVGTAFADKARSMHLGEAPAAQIHGQATADEARALAEEGVPVAPLPLPIVPPETCN
ncbi:DUF1178 family protein [Sphingomonas sp.]|uniref:DUF1178 family protein n=1 Tax=Sphingomonas sp. TaxID=28214 RepID=UPI002ED8CC3C